MNFCVLRVWLRTSLGCWVPLDAQVLCQTLGQKPSHGQTVAILKKKKTGKEKRTEVIFLQMHPDRFVTLSWSPRWLRLRGSESTCLQSTPHCFSGSERWHFCKNERRREQEMTKTWRRSAADESEWQAFVKIHSIICRWQEHRGGQCGERTLQRKKCVDNFPFIKWTQSKHFLPLLWSSWLSGCFFFNGKWK